MRKTNLDKLLILALFMVVIAQITLADTGTEIEKFATATCSSSHPSYPCANVNDNTTNKWANGVNELAWVKLTWAKKQSIANMTLSNIAAQNQPVTLWYYDYTVNDYVIFDTYNINGFSIINVTNFSRVTDIVNLTWSVGVDVDFEEWKVVNQSDIVPDFDPPHITYYNLTNTTIGSTGCVNWNDDKNDACITSSLTPTLQFNTSENAWCAIAGSSNASALNKNYTGMGASRHCTGSASGEGTRNHLCTLTPQDEFVYETSYLFISCTDDRANENRTNISTSGPLKLNITGIESTARSSIELGIKNSLNSYAIYTDQKIYARNAANTQSVGAFDKVVKKLSKIWAFNRIGVSEAHVNMFNITPVLYVWEFSNKTSTNITKGVELLINSTR